MKFNIDSPWWKFMDTCARFFMLNVIFILSVLPVVTIGPALKALYETVFRYQDDADISLMRTYWKAFRAEFLQACTSSAIYGIVYSAIIFALAFWSALSGSTSSIATPILVIALFWTIITTEYHFALLARFEATYAQTWKNSLLLPWHVYKHTIALLAIDIAFIAICTYTQYARFFAVLIGFAWVTYAKSFVLLHAFAQVDDENRHGRSSYAHGGLDGPYEA